MCEDGEEDAVHGGSVLENAHGSGPSPDFSETPFDGVGGSHGLSLLKGLVAKAGEQLAEVGPEAIDGLGVGLLPAVGEAALSLLVMLWTAPTTGIAMRQIAGPVAE